MNLLGWKDGSSLVDGDLGANDLDLSRNAVIAMCNINLIEATFILLVLF